VSEATIHMRVPAALKRRWVQLSRAEGYKLTDWIIAAVERDMSQRLTRIAIPHDLTFSDLNLSRDADGQVSFDRSVIERICAASDIPPALFFDTSEDNVAGLIVEWYHAHLNAGGARDAVADDLIAEQQAEDRAGQPFSYPPGTA